MAEDAVEEVAAGEATPPENLSTQGYEALKAEESVEYDYLTVRDQKFRVADEIPGIVLLDLGLATDPAATQGEGLRAMRSYLNAAIHEDDVDRFNVYLRNARPVIDIDGLNKIVEELVTIIAGRPTKSPSI